MNEEFFNKPDITIESADGDKAYITLLAYEKGSGEPPLVEAFEKFAAESGNNPSLISMFLKVINNTKMPFASTYDLSRMLYNRSLSSLRKAGDGAGKTFRGSYTYINGGHLIRIHYKSDNL